MRFLHRVVRLAVLVLVIGAGAGLMVLALSGTNWDIFAAACREGRWTAIWLGLGLFCTGLLFGLSGLHSRPRERYLSFEGEKGTVSISTIAIADYLTRLREEFPSVVRLRPRVIPVRRAVDIVVDLRVKSGSQVHEVCETLQQRIRESMISGLGISDVRRVEVSVRDIVSEHRPR